MPVNGYEAVHLASKWQPAVRGALKAKTSHCKSLPEAENELLTKYEAARKDVELAHVAYERAKDKATFDSAGVAELFRSVYGGQLTQDRLCALVALSYSAQLRVLSETRSPLFAQRRPRARRVSEGLKKICMVGVHGWGEVVLSETMTVEERCQFPIKCLMCSRETRFHCSE